MVKEAFCTSLGLSLAIRFCFILLSMTVCSEHEMTSELAECSLRDMGTSWMDLGRATSGDVRRGQTCSDVLYLALRNYRKSTFSHSRNMLFKFYLFILRFKGRTWKRSIFMES